VKTVIKIYFLKKTADIRETMQRDSFLRDQYLIQSNDSMRNMEQILLIHASLDPRFNSLLTRAANYRTPVYQQKVSPTDRVPSPNSTSPNLKAWLPKKTSNKKKVNTQTY
jgi:hypothetical protein